MVALRFAASSSVVGEDEIHIQGDHTDELVDLIAQKFPQVGWWLLIPAASAATHFVVFY